MLVLTRKVEQEILIEHPGGNIVIKVTRVERDRAAIGIIAPESMNIRRAEVPVREVQ